MLSGLVVDLCSGVALMLIVEETARQLEVDHSDAHSLPVIDCPTGGQRESPARFAWPMAGPFPDPEPSGGSNAQK